MFGRKPRQELVMRENLEIQVKLEKALGQVALREEAIEMWKERGDRLGAALDCERSELSNLRDLYVRLELVNKELQGYKEATEILSRNRP